MTPDDAYVPCPRCGGSGLIDSSACRELIKGRACRNRLVDDEEFFEVFPDREDLRGYCSLHRNARVRSGRRETQRNTLE